MLKIFVVKGLYYAIVEPLFRFIFECLHFYISELLSLFGKVLFLSGIPITEPNTDSQTLST